MKNRWFKLDKVLKDLRDPDRIGSTEKCILVLAIGIERKPCKIGLQSQGDLYHGFSPSTHEKKEQQLKRRTQGWRPNTLPESTPNENDWWKKTFV